MSRIYVCIMLVAALVLFASQLPLSASAADLFVKKSESSETQKRELFLRNGKGGQDFTSPTLNRVNRTKDWKMPASWALLDEMSRKTKKAETDRVVSEQRQLEALINKENAKRAQKIEASLAIQDKQERAILSGEKIASAKEKVLQNKPNIKKTADPKKPRKLFNSSQD